LVSNFNVISNKKVPIRGQLFAYSVNI